MIFLFYGFCGGCRFQVVVVVVCFGFVVLGFLLLLMFWFCVHDCFLLMMKNHESTKIALKWVF